MAQDDHVILKAADQPRVSGEEVEGAIGFDQRGNPFVRTFGGGTDIGAFEAQPYATLPALGASMLIYAVLHRFHIGETRVKP